MSACNFTIPFSGSPSQILQKAQTAVQGQGGTFRGDETSGVFQLSVLGSDIRGSFTIMGQDLQVTIDSKPFMIPCSTIESYLTKHLETVGAQY
jgi:hypothetical protein